MDSLPTPHKRILEGVSEVVGSSTDPLLLSGSSVSSLFQAETSLFRAYPLIQPGSLRHPGDWMTMTHRRRTPGRRPFINVVLIECFILPRRLDTL